MAFLLRLVWVVVVVFLIRFVVVRLFRRGIKQGPEQPRVISGRARSDPRCGTYVAEELAVRAFVGGQELFFCSAECRDAFRPQLQ